MRSLLNSLVNDEGGSTRARVVALFGMLGAFNLAAWCWAFVAFHRFPVLLGTAFLAYSFGLRHAVDADHIAAIDNVTRKLMQQGKRPVAVGLMFSLGHSTIVIVGSIVNLIVLQSVIRSFARVRRGEPYVDEDFDLLLGSRGFLSRLFRPMFNLIRRSWHMYPLGILFGLGFDTATEIGLLGISAAEASKGLSLSSILVFPVLFAAGMSLIDSTDNILMLGAYGWAFVKPVRKLYYNITITSVSVVVALAVGGIEALGLLAGQFHLTGGLWGLVGKLNDTFGMLGYGIVALFALSWALSIAIYKWRRFDDLEFVASEAAPAQTQG
jgi:high-affinity nickel-transport protein